MAIGAAASPLAAVKLVAAVLVAEVLPAEESPAEGLIAEQLIAEGLAMDIHWDRNRRQRKSELAYCGGGPAIETVLKEKGSLVEGNQLCLG